MILKKWMRLSLTLCLLLTVVFWAPSLFAADSFYKGKTVTIIAGYKPGGGVDAHARLFARHIGRFIPGNPKMIVKNMHGAGGGVAANHMYNKVDPDGLTLSVPGRSWEMDKLYKMPGIMHDPLKFGYIGSPGPTPMYLWLRSDLGIKNVEDLKNYKGEVLIGGLTPRTDTALVPRILADAAKFPLKVLTGYKGTAKIMLAVEQKEVHGIFSPRSTLRRRADLLDKKVLFPLLVSLPVEKDLPDCMSVISEEAKPLMKIVLGTHVFGIPIIGPPNMPDDRLKMLRDSFMAMSRDKDYLADAKKIGASDGPPHSGEKVHELIADVINGATDEALESYFRYTK